MLHLTLLTGLALGLGWAVRGHFGHEHGAAWAGAIACIALVAGSGRRDWQLKLPVVASLGGIGWGVGGAMSYGLLVGYSRSGDLTNAFYGLVMLGLVGALYGFIGGGFCGLALETTDENRPDWPRLLTEMTAGGILGWGTLIFQFGWLANPPRSEMWAACLGAAVALAWFLFRNGFSGSSRLAAFSALGAGIGFPLGSFLQSLGTLSGLSYNWWNLMEFTLGFCGGIGMAYAVCTWDWPESSRSNLSTTRGAWLFLLTVLPLVNFIQAFDMERLIASAQQLGLADPNRFASLQWWLGGGLILAILATTLIVFRLPPDSRPGPVSTITLFGFTTGFVLLGHIRKAFPAAGPGEQPEQVIYWLLLVMTGLVFWRTNRRPPSVKVLKGNAQKGKSREITTLAAATIVLLFGLAVLLVSLHDGLPGSHLRFP